MSSAYIGIFCNNCSRDKNFGTVVFYATECYHVVCAVCQRGSVTVCSHCKQACDMVEINPNMQDDVKSWFKTNYIADLFERIIKVWNFQSKQYELWAAKYANVTTESCDGVFRQMDKSTKKNEKFLEQMQKEEKHKKELKEAMRTGKITVEMLKRGEDELRKRRIVFGFSFIPKQPQKVNPLLKMAHKNNYNVVKNKGGSQASESMSSSQRSTSAPSTRTSISSSNDSGFDKLH